MEQNLTNEMVELIAQVGALVKKDARCGELQKTIDAYEHSDDLNKLIAEYNTQQNILADGFQADGADLEFRKSVQARIDALYDEITTHPVYVEYVTAKQAFDGLMNDIYGELQFAITGERPCTHDCSSCHSDCHHDHHHE